MYKLIVGIFILLNPINLFCQEPITINLKPINPDSIKYLEGIPLWPKINPPAYIEESQRSVRTGSLILNNSTFQVGIFNFRTNKYSKSSMLWFDLNQNNKYDFSEDFLESMRLPFTLQQTSYEVMHVDSSGKCIKFRKSKIPPIAIGLFAPNFEALTIDSTNFQFKQFKGMPIFLYFWTCNPNNHIKTVYEVANHFKDKNIKIICIGPKIQIDTEGYINDPRVALNDKNIKVNFVYVVGQDMSDKNRRLYQVGSLMKSFCIDNEGVIKSIDQPFTKTEIIEVIEEFLNGI